MVYILRDKEKNTTVIDWPLTSSAQVVCANVCKPLK